MKYTIKESNLYQTTYFSFLGNITLLSDGQNLIGLNFNKYLKITRKDDLETFLPVKKWLDSYFKSNFKDINFPIKPYGTDFQKSIWNILLKIPYGKTTTYGDIARQIAVEKGIKNMSAQAVGQAIKHNPLLIIIPCHRVLAKNSIGGYSAGTDVKTKLLELENII